MIAYFMDDHHLMSQICPKLVHPIVLYLVQLLHVVAQCLYTRACKLVGAGSILGAVVQAWLCFE